MYQMPEVLSVLYHIMSYAAIHGLAGMWCCLIVCPKKSHVVFEIVLTVIKVSFLAAKALSTTAPPVPILLNV